MLDSIKVKNYRHFMGEPLAKKMITAYKRGMKMTELRDKGLSMAAIGKIFGISRQRVFILLKEQKTRVDKMKKKSTL